MGCAMLFLCQCLQESCFRTLAAILVSYYYFYIFLKTFWFYLFWRKHCQRYIRETWPDMIWVVCVLTNLLPFEHQRKTVFGDLWHNQLWWPWLVDGCRKPVLGVWVLPWLATGLGTRWDSSESLFRLKYSRSFRLSSAAHFNSLLNVTSFEDFPNYYLRVPLLVNLTVSSTSLRLKIFPNCPTSGQFDCLLNVTSFEYLS